ncbi:diguanylate cyclase (GGDEF)-like protein [Paenibacillus taihuensis]|uniref:Diguanylate cyclase (GGDEF)-like protein n=1 Tax=Paenibacillus taihuensis TaxID=1156355 RepID=A0A3D9Q0N5_9BACL|nr:GGDEF domain-containing protein [Paenibacillus taihuensis]REE56355.1 diguanylate cyclase (GGDEF)-like protein [Paenibacillus taihuensis]
MDYESINYNRYRWNRMLLTGFWSILVITIILECLYSTVTDLPLTQFFIEYMVRPSALLLGLLLLAELGLRLYNGRYQDYIVILTSTLIAFTIVYIHDSINYLILALFLPIMVSIFYFQTKKLLFALGNTLASLYIMYGTNYFLNNDISIVGLITISIMFCLFTLIAWGILRRGMELLSHLKSNFERNQELLVKTIWMDKLAKTDALTGLYNHITFHEYFEKLIDQHERYGLALQLAIIDIDNFKHVNDTYGHRAGDAVLMSVSEMLRSKARVNDFIARYGGEEFAILFTDQSRVESLTAVELIRDAISRLSQQSLDGKSVTVSIGFAEYTSEEGKEHFFNRVDMALYKAKNSGKNRTVVSTDLRQTDESQLA